MPTLEIELLGTVVLVLVLGPFVIHRLVGELTGAAHEDRRWKEARAELGERGLHLIAFDSRFLRPWGPSTACVDFVRRAHDAGLGWLGPEVVRFHDASPTLIRAVVGDLEGVKVAWVVASTRRDGVLVRKVVAADARGLAEAAPAAPAPPEGFVEELALLARRTKAAA
jgi:hypothetical protein